MEKLQIAKLKGKSNWSIWRLQIESNLQYHDFEGVLTGKIADPGPLPDDATNQQKKEHDASLKAYKKANGYAVTLLSTTVDDESLQLILMFKTAKEMWNKLQSSFEQKSEQRLEHLYLQLLEYKKDPADSVATHISKLQKLWLELNEESTRIDDCQLPETLLLMRILSTLPDEYFEFRTTWESVPREQRSVEYLLERLTMIEMRVMKKQNDTAPTTSALFVKSKGHQPTKNKPKKDLSKVKCYSCHQFGHFKSKCPNKNISSTGSKGASAQSNESALYSEALLTETTSIDDLWIADTGASHHMTKLRTVYATYSAFDNPKPIIIGKSHTQLLAFGQGDIKIKALVDGKWKQHCLKDVLYTPDVVKNLFSVSTAADKGAEYWLDKKSCRLTRNGETIVIGERCNKLYKLNIQIVQPDSPAEVYVSNKNETLQVWHERFGHQSKQYVEKYLKKHGIEYIKDNQFCEGCVLGKQHRRSFGTRINAQSPGELVHSDVCGPMQESSFRGFRYFVTFKDDFSKYRHVYFMKQKSEVAAKLKQFLAETKTIGHTVRELLTDGGGEYECKEVADILHEYGISHRVVMPYTPEQNGAAERENRTLMEAARSMMQSTMLPQKLWAEAVNTSCYILNRTGPTKTDGVSPYELWTGKQAPVDHLKIFGTQCFVHIPKQKRQKLDAKAIKGYLVGYCGNKDGYRVYIPEKNDIALSRDVIFKDELPSVTEQPTELVETEVEFQTDNDTVTDQSNTDVIGEQILMPRNKRQIKRPIKFDDYAMFAGYEEPESYMEALESSNTEEWKAAMDEEMNSLMENDTWDLVEKPADRSVIDNRWVYRVKLNLDGSVNKFKARLVAKGYSQRAGTDYDETFSPVARFDTIRAVLSVAASHQMKLGQFDVKTAFLYGDLEESIFMKQPPGYDDGTDKVCRLKRSLYGLKQSPRCWNKRFKSFLEKHQLKQSDADPCMFYKNHAGHKLIIVLYVDDGLVAYQDKADFETLIADLKAEFQCTVSSASCFLGLQINQAVDGSVSITQENYTKRILEKFGMSECNKIDTPMERQTQSADNEVNDGSLTKVPYRQAVGSLMYLAVGTRPDIMYAVSHVSQALENPTQNDWSKVKRIFKYLKGTSDISIVYGSNHQKMLTTYSDADFAGDARTRRSTSGVVCMYMGGPISWISRRQKSVALSTTEAEFVAASEASKEAVWLMRLLNEITELSSVPRLLIDNMSAVKLVKNPVFHKRSKHIEVRHFFVREKVEEGQLTVEHVPSESQLADILTKPLCRDTFVKIRELLGIIKP